MNFLDELDQKHLSEAEILTFLEDSGFDCRLDEMRYQNAPTGLIPAFVGEGHITFWIKVGITVYALFETIIEVTALEAERGARQAVFGHLEKAFDSICDDEREKSVRADEVGRAVTRAKRALKTRIVLPNVLIRVDTECRCQVVEQFNTEALVGAEAA